MVTLVDVTLQAPKELNEVRLALVEVVKAAKDGKTSELLAKLGVLLAAVDGLAQVPVEVKEELKKSAAVIGLLGGELAGVLLA